MRYRNKTLATIVGLVAVWGAVLLPLAVGAGPLLNPRAADPSEPWNIEADVLEYDEAANAYQGQGNVRVWRSGYELNADSAGFDRGKNTLWAEGNVTVEGGGDVLTGDRMELDLTHETGAIDNGSLFIQATHFFIRGGRIEKSGAQSYQVKDASLTTCDPENPDWEIQAGEVKVTVGGYGIAKNLLFRAKKVPVLYSPFLVFPAKTERQTGLLPPQVSHSTRHGWGVNQPFYWVMSDSADMTFYAHPMELRGPQFGAELRYVMAPECKGYAFGSLLQDMKADDGLGDNSDDWGYPHDAWLRLNQDRYWFAAKHDYKWNNGARFRLDADIVSDQDYLRDFREGYTGFSAVNSYFSEEFGRSLDDYDETVRKNGLYLQKGWNRYSFNAETKWWDNVIARRFDQQDYTLQTLPFFGFSGARQSLFGSPASVEFETAYAHLYREDGVSGHRMDFHPRFYMPFDFSRFANLEASAGLRETVWHVNTWQDDPSRDKRAFSRELYDLRADLTSQLVRTFSMKGDRMDKIRHSLSPTLSYVYSPNVIQEKYPLFDNIDRIQGRNYIRLALANSLLARSRNDSPEGEDAFTPFEYNELCWFELAAAYDINEAGESNPANWSKPHRREPFSPVSARLELHPAAWASLESTVKWSPYDGSLIYNSQGVTLDLFGHSLTAEYIDAEESSESIRGEANLRIAERWTAYGCLDRDLEAGERVKNSVGIVYSAPCWSVDMGYSDEPGEQRYEFQLTLQGLGAIGRSAGRKL